MRLEQRDGGADLRRSPVSDWHAHEVTVGSVIDDLAAVMPPPQLGRTVLRDLPLPTSRRREALYSDLVRRSRFAGDIGHPFAIGRNSALRIRETLPLEQARRPLTDQGQDPDLYGSVPKGGIQNGASVGRPGVWRHLNAGPH